MSGRLIGIAWRGARRAPMQTVDRIEIRPEFGVKGDHKGAKFKRRAVTVLAREDWEAALADVAGDASDLFGEKPSLAWTARRANLLVEGLRLPRAVGARLSVGPILLEVTYPTTPCARMDEALCGLRRALHPEWRGGVTCSVIEGGEVRLGDAVAVVSSPPERRIRLPG